MKEFITFLNGLDLIHPSFKVMKMEYVKHRGLMLACTHYNVRYYFNLYVSKDTIKYQEDTRPFSLENPHNYALRVDELDKLLEIIEERYEKYKEMR